MKKLLITFATSLLFANGAFAQDIQLPTPDKSNSMTLMQALQQRQSGREFSTRAIDNQTLSQVLWAACGINRPESKKITAPSAINAQDIQVYVASKDGVYLYLPLVNKLQKVTDEDVRPLVAGRQASIGEAPIHLILVSDLSKFGNRQNDATITMATMDSGYVSENISLICTALGLVTVPRMMMDKEGLKKALQLTDHHELLLNNPIGWPK